MFSSSATFISGVLSEFNIHATIDVPQQIRHLTNDSRQIGSGDIYCAVKGTQQHGKQYINQAIEQGCHLVIVECECAHEHGHIEDAQHQQKSSTSCVKIISFYQLNKHLFNLAKAFYQQPQNKLTMIGVTGTNGKTSTSQMIAKLLDANKQSSAVIGTNGAGNVNKLIAINNTTPGATELHQLLSQFVEQGQKQVAMEVSSHALSQGRVTADLFDIAIFTNLTRDHLDYHKTMNDYAQAKFKLFSHTPDQVAIINGDDDMANQWLASLTNDQRVIVFGRTERITSNPLFVQATDISHKHDGVEFQLNSHLGSINISCHLIGDFNVDNLLAAIAVLIQQQTSLPTIQQLVKSLSPTVGRMEAFSAEHMPVAIVDYAHTPDALSNALSACRQHCQGTLWVVFGCGGDRDKGKRPLMGRIAEKQADNVVITNDNPRSELPDAIAQDVLAGCHQPDKITVMLERQKAVLTTLKKAKDNDVVLLAGKGHEDYIIVGDQHVSYNERELVRSTYANGTLS